MNWYGRLDRTNSNELEKKIVENRFSLMKIVHFKIDSYDQKKRA